MKTITIHFDLDVYTKLRSALAVKGLSGSAYGLTDAFMYRLLENIKDNVTEWTPKPKTEVD